MYSTQELQDLAAVQPPLRPQGTALVFVCVSVVCLACTYMAIALRVWSRAWRRSRIWGWDDTLSVLGVAAYTVNVAYAILCALYGLGTPDDQLTMPHVVRALYAYTGWEVSYCIAIDLAKTSIGVAILRIAGHQPAHRRVVWALLFVTNVLYVGCGIWVLAMCSAGGAPWNMLYNTCAANTIIVPLLYCAVAIGAATDAGFALVPIFIVRGLQMETRLKRTLMIVMGLGSLAAVASLSRFPWGRYMPPHYGNMYHNGWINILSMIETALALVFGTLPAIGKMLHLYDNKRTQGPSVMSPALFGRQTIGGTPFVDTNRTEGQGLIFVPSGRGETQTRIWSDFRDVASTLVDPPSPGEERKSSVRGRESKGIQQEFAVDVE